MRNRTQKERGEREGEGGGRERVMEIMKEV
jgi:hypothetical protein